jgi:hypothetical protein
VQHPFVEIRGLAKDQRICRHPSDMSARLGVIGFDRVEQRLESCRSQSLRARISATLVQSQRSNANRGANGKRE